MRQHVVRGWGFLRGETARDVFLLIGIALLTRLIVHFTFAPAWGGDSIGYWAAGRNFCHQLRSYEFGRTPVYPLLLHACEDLCAPSTIERRLSCPAAMMVVLCQHLLGIALSCMLYKTLRNLKIGRWLALGTGVIYGSLLCMAVMERYLLPLSLALSLLGISTWLFSEGLVSGRRCLFVLSGIGFSLTVLTRPETLIFLLIFVFAYGFASSVCGKRSSLRSQLLPFVAGASPLVVAWIILFRTCLGFFGMSILSGWNHSATAYNMFHLVEEKDATLARSWSSTTGDLYVKTWSAMRGQN